MLPRMRTIEQCVSLIKEFDNETAITIWYIRTLVQDNKIAHTNTGKKILVNFDNLVGYLNKLGVA